ncbi:hypothetical protein ACHAW5_005776 [Stephanodiscus triporus]|uniref:Trs120/TRAPPC9 N-terminal domain-containing protein n=1 Tax=Stephanodiscus triporus TaxID=2934178 RepID=A0ABD3PU89_9STRA
MAWDRLRGGDDDFGDFGDGAADPWTDLEPHRSTSAVIGVLNMRDCRDTSDLWRAEEDLARWARSYRASPSSSSSSSSSSSRHHHRREDVALLGSGDDDHHRTTHAPIVRLFVFDSFDESVQRRVDLGRTRFKGNQLVAFPPLDMGVGGGRGGGGANSQMMALHWNVVVNDLAVALFRNVERRIRENDALAKSGWTGVTTTSRHNIGGGGGKIPPSVGSDVGASSSSSSSSSSVPAGGGGNKNDGGRDDMSSRSLASTNTTSASTNASGASTPATVGGGVGGLLKNAFDGWRPASAASAASVGVGGGGSHPTSFASDHRRASSSSSSSAAAVASGVVGVGGAASKLVTPLDLDADDADVLASVTPRDLEALKRRDAGRREKRSADLSLLAGSPIDAYERYTRAAELTRQSHDPLWYASALEGCACAFVAMADVGGHGVDEYLENNFQLPDVIMALAIAQGVASGADLGDAKGKTMTVDRTKTTLPQAVTALVEEAMSVLCRHEALAPLHAGLLLKLAEYVREDEEGHLRCRWGEGAYCYGGDANSKPPRWERTTVSRLDLRGAEVREILASDSIERGRKFTELLHRAASVGGLDDRSRADVAAACARACLIGTKETRWGDSKSCSTSPRLRFPRKAAFFTLVAAEAMARCQSDDSAECASNLYLAASHLYSRQGNVFEHGDDCATRYGWATLRAAALQGLSSQLVDKEVAEAGEDSNYAYALMFMSRVIISFIMTSHFASQFLLQRRNS